MSPARPLLLALAILALGACSQTSSTRGRWLTTAGQPADPAALRAASTRCRERVKMVVTRAGPGESQEWGLAMLDCLRGEGFVVVTDDPELAH
jgi:hypothetical protein